MSAEETYLERGEWLRLEALKIAAKLLSGSTSASHHTSFELKNIADNIITYVRQGH